MWLTRLALRNPILIFMISIGVVVLGLTSLARLPVDLFPSISPPLVQIATFYPGASPQSIERTITYPIEKAVSSVSNVDRVQSTSKQGASIVRVWFNWDADLNVGELEVIERVQQVMNNLPQGVQQPFVLKIDLSNIPVCMVTASVGSGGLDERGLRDLADNTIVNQLERLPFVASADLSGGLVRQINVEVDREALKSRGLGVLDVVRAISAANLLLPSGLLRADDRSYNLFTNSQIEAAKAIESVVLRSDQKGTVLVRDVARVIDGAEDQANSVRVLTRRDVPDPEHPGQMKHVLEGGRGVMMRVMKQSGANTVEIVDRVKEALPKLRGVPEDVRLGLFFDQSTYIRSALTSLRHEALTGSLLAVLIILVFIRSFRSTLIIAVAIPLSVITTFILMYFTKQSLNVFTLGGLALGIGRLVDDSIVELENIQRHLNLRARENGGRLDEAGRRQAALDAAEEVAMPILASTITTIVVFFPVVFLIGIPKLLFIPLTLTIAFSLFCSFLVSRTMTPILCVKFLRPEEEHGEAQGGWARLARASDRVDRAYERLLGRALRHRRLVFALVLVAFGGAIYLFRFVPSEFFPETDESQFTAFLRMPVGTRMERTEEAAKRLEKTIVDAVGVDDVQTIVTTVGVPSGRSALFSANTGPHAANVNVNLVQPDQRKQTTDQLLAKVRRLAYDGRFAGAMVYFFSGGIVRRVLNFGSEAPIAVEIVGYDLENARRLARQVAEAMRAIPGLTDVEVRREENFPELDVRVDREKAARLGFSQQEIANTILTSMSGNSNSASIYTDPVSGNEYRIIVRLADRYRDEVRDLGEVYLTTRAGQPVSVATLADINRSSGPVQIDRRSQQRIIEVTANPIGRDLGGLTADIERSLAKLVPPPGFSLVVRGQSEAQASAFRGLAFASLLALMLVYMVMASQFRSLLDPFIIMFSVPMGLIGVALALLAWHTPLSVNSFMGIIMMVGIVVSNGVLLVDYTRLLREEGRPLEEAVRTAARTRLRPILMTTLATVLGLLPMALGMGVGSEANMPLARAVIGGLSVSTVLTLFLVPSLYLAFEGWMERRRAK
jgi:CzcA family heavy metal efflux pump